jgi:hypothetical protein
MNKSSLEELKQDMEDKRKTAAAYADAAVAAAAAAAAAAAYEAAASAAAAYTAYAAAYDADAYDVYEAAKKKYEKALEQAPVASSDGPSELQVSRWFGESTIKFHISDRMNYIAQKAWQAALEKDNE